MSQKKCGADRGTHAMRRLVVATAVDQSDCAPSATQSGVGAQMDPAVSSGRADVVSGTIPTTTPDGPACVATFEQAVIRAHARRTSPRNPLGFYGAEAIAQESADAGVRPVHSIRTIHRILARHKLVPRTRRDRSRRGPNLPTPPARCLNDMHHLDFIGGHYLAARRPGVIVNRKDLATGLVGGTEEPDRRVQRVPAFLTRDWHRHGRPRFLQMDNDMSLTGGRFHPRSLGQLIRFCLACRVIPVFTPERQPAANARGERDNGLWQEKVWQRYRFRTLRHLRVRSHAFQVAYNTYLTRRLIRQGHHTRLNGLRHPLPVPFRVPTPLPLYRGPIWVIRRVDEEGLSRVIQMSPVRVIEKSPPWLRGRCSFFEPHQARFEFLLESIGMPARFRTALHSTRDPGLRPLVTHRGEWLATG